MSKLHISIFEAVGWRGESPLSGPWEKIFCTEDWYFWDFAVCYPACHYDSKFTDVHEFEISGKRTGYVAGVSKELENMITKMQFTIYENVEVFHTLFITDAFISYL